MAPDIHLTHDDDAWMPLALAGLPHLLRHWPDRLRHVRGQSVTRPRLAVALGYEAQAVYLTCNAAGDWTIRPASIDWDRITLPSIDRELGRKASRILSGGSLAELYEEHCKMSAPMLQPDRVLVQADADLSEGRPETAPTYASHTWQALLGEALGSLAVSVGAGGVLAVGPCITTLAKTEHVFDREDVLKDAFETGADGDQAIALDVVMDHMTAAGVGKLYLKR